MHEFNQLEDKGHHSIHGMIEKCASLAAEFYAEMDAEDQIDNEIDDYPENQSNFDMPSNSPVISTPHLLVAFCRKSSGSLIDMLLKRGALFMIFKLIFLYILTVSK
jgi:hypothetical protein